MKTEKGPLTTLFQNQTKHNNWKLRYPMGLEADFLNQSVVYKQLEDDKRVLKLIQEEYFFLTKHFTQWVKILIGGNFVLIYHTFHSFMY